MSCLDRRVGPSLLIYSMSSSAVFGMQIILIALHLLQFPPVGFRGNFTLLDCFIVSRRLTQAHSSRARQGV